MLVRTPTPDLQDLAVLDEIHRIRDEVSDTLRTPRRWTGILRRNNQARAIRGSNSIEGIDVDLDDAVAAVEDEQPLTADERTFTEIQGYRMALGYVLATADDPAAGIDGSTIRTLHYMMLSHDLAAAPGRYRAGEIFVRDEESGNLVYTGPDPDRVPSLVTELVTSLAGPGSEDGFIDAAMAHLNLVMIHPFRDGNGRMARCLQTLVLGRRGVTEPLFSSIEEWLGHNTEDYDRILGVVGRGAWNPDNDAASWLKFCLRAHHMQAQTQQQRIAYAARLGDHVTAVLAENRLPERAFDALYEAAVGLKVRRQRYMTAGIDQRTATRDLTQLSALNLLVAKGQGPGRYYQASQEFWESLRSIRREMGAISDPYPGFIRQVRGWAEDLRA